LFSFGTFLAGDDETVDRTSEPTVRPLPSANNPLLCREAVFDRQNNLCAHIFQLHHEIVDSAPESDSPRLIDRLLLDILANSDAAWNTQGAYIPIGSGALWEESIDRLPPTNLTLLIRLSLKDSDPEALLSRLTHLSERGFGIGLFHQPWHPAFNCLLPLASLGVIDAGAAEGSDIHDFRALFSVSRGVEPLDFLATNIGSLDEQRLCLHVGIDLFHGHFAASAPLRPHDSRSDPHKVQLLNLMQLIEADAETAELAKAIKEAPILTFRILRYLNSPAVGLTREIDSINQAIMLLGRQRLGRWLAILLFSTEGAGLADWLLIESALTRGRLMEELGRLSTPVQSGDPLFLTGIFSCLDRLLQRPLQEIANEMPLAENIRAALLDGTGPLGPLLALAKASDTQDPVQLETAAQAAGFDCAQVNQALLVATAWASGVTQHWE